MAAFEVDALATFSVGGRDRHDSMDKFRRNSDFPAAETFAFAVCCGREGCVPVCARITQHRSCEWHKTEIVKNLS